MEERTQVMPVTRWGTSQAPSHQVGLLRLEYLSTPDQKPDQAHASPVYGFSPQQLRALADSLRQVADQLEAAALPR